MRQQPPTAPAPAPKRKRIYWWRMTVWLLLLSFIILQFYQPDKNNNSVSLTNDISAVVSVPDSVQVSLQAACYDCHSNNTRYPWYTDIQPVGWWLGSHINDGKRHLNFHEFATYSTERQKEKLGGIMESVREGWMPLKSYTWIHKEAKLSELQKQQIIRWTEEAKKHLSSPQ